MNRTCFHFHRIDSMFYSVFIIQLKRGKTNSSRESDRLVRYMVNEIKILTKRNVFYT